jgi:protein-tyrosine-phosphatase
MSQSATQVNAKLVDSLARIILSLTDEERQLLEQKIHTQEPSKVNLDQFFQELDSVATDPNQQPLQEISEVVREVRRELWSTH